MSGFSLIEPGELAAEICRHLLEISLEILEIFDSLGRGRPIESSAMMAEAQGSLNQLDPSWSSPIFFYPDGTTSTARLLLSNQYQDWIAVRLRGLTGVARSEPVDENEELLP